MPSANSYSSPSVAGGNREDLRDILTVVAPESTPVLSSIKTGPGPRATFTEVLVDDFRPVNTTGTPEGQDAFNFQNKGTPRARIGNYIHIIRDDFAVTDVQEMVEHGGGISSEWARAKAKSVIEVKRDIESVLCGSQDRQAGTGDAGWTTRGLVNWIASASPADVPAQYRTGAASIASFGTTDVGLGGVLANLFSFYGEPKSFLAPTGVTSLGVVDNLSNTIPGGTPTNPSIARNDGYVSGATVSRVVKRYVTSFGDVTFVPDVFVNVSAGVGNVTASLILNMDLLELQWMDAIHAAELEDHGGGKRGFVKAIFSLCVKNPKGLGRLT
jgi:hypothetical protein